MKDNYNDKFNLPIQPVGESLGICGDDYGEQNRISKYALLNKSFTDKLNMLDIKEEFRLIQSSDFAKHLLFDFYRILCKVIENKELSKIYNEEIPLTQSTARVNDSKISGSIIYRGKNLSLNYFFYKFSKDLLNIIENKTKSKMEKIILLDDLVEERI